MFFAIYYYLSLRENRKKEIYFPIDELIVLGRNTNLFGIRV